MPAVIFFNFSFTSKFQTRWLWQRVLGTLRSPLFQKFCGRIWSVALYVLQLLSVCSSRHWSTVLTVDNLYQLLLAVLGELICVAIVPGIFLRMIGTGHVAGQSSSYTISAWNVAGQKFLLDSFSNACYCWFPQEILLVKFSIG